jgi:hypothetical protein
VHRTRVQVKHMVCRTKSIATCVSSGEPSPNARWIAAYSPRSLALAGRRYWQLKNLAKRRPRIWQTHTVHCGNGPGRSWPPCIRVEAPRGGTPRPLRRRLRASHLPEAGCDRDEKLVAGPPRRGRNLCRILIIRMRARLSPGAAGASLGCGAFRIPALVG